MAAPFVHLHVHSHYSLLKALPKIPDLVAAAKKEGCEALALTDLGSMYGTIEFIKECRKAEIKPIVGLDIAEEGGGRIILLVENAAGYKNLLALMTAANFAEHQSEPVVTLEELAGRTDGLLAIGNHLSGAHVFEYQKLFGKDNFYVNVAMQEIFYIAPKDRRAWETLCAIGDRGPTDHGDISDEEENYAFPTAGEMQKRFPKEALDQTLTIAARCNLEITLGSWIFPPYTTQDGITYDQELRRIIEKGLAYRGFKETPTVRERIEYEYKIICDKGYSPYFLVVADLLHFARESGILATTRGSAGGSLVSYLTGVTTINPLEYQLPFERFLNPERPKAPDIDMDFADNRRDEVIDYVRKTYCENRVAQIGTFGTMLARGVVRDVARALGHPYGLGDRIAREVPFGSQGFPMTLDRALEENATLKKMYESEPDVHDIIDLGKKIEGCARHISVHAAGVVISPGPLVEYAPLQHDPKSTNKEGGKIITQYDMYSITDEYGGVGLLKFDFLGIRNLAILAHAVKLVENTRWIKVDIERVPVDDTKTFEMLARGETEGTFQLGGAGMTRYLKELRPTSIHDINAMVALFRPGPMETIPSYIERKHNPALITYLDPRMKDYLDFSYGLLVYQDDVLLTAIKIAGYSWLEADALRKAMGKKIPAEMEKQREKLIAGAVKNGMSQQKAEMLWKLIEPFAAYGFGKAHAASYGRVAYQTAYMKANFPVEYMAAVLTAEAGDIDTVSVMVRECKRMGVPVLPPDINESFGDFTVVLNGSGNAKVEPITRFANGSVSTLGFPDPEKVPPPGGETEPSAPRTIGSPPGGGTATNDSIRFGLYSIKNVGSGVADSIIAERKARGPFVSISDFLRRIKDQNLNKRGLESLIECGALDCLGEPGLADGGRGTMLASIELLLEYHRETSKEQQQDSLFAGQGDVADITLPPAEAATQAQRLAWEKELLGLYVSGHPLDRFKEQLSKRPMTLEELHKKMTPGMTAVAAGMVESVRTILTRGGDQMAFVKITDHSGSIEAAVFPRVFAEHKDILKPDAVIALKGRLSQRNGELSMVADKLKVL